MNQDDERNLLFLAEGMLLSLAIVGAGLLAAMIIAYLVGCMPIWWLP